MTGTGYIQTSLGIVRFNNYAKVELAKDFGVDPVEVAEKIAEVFGSNPYIMLHKIMRAGLIGYQYQKCNFGYVVNDEAIGEWVADQSDGEIIKVWDAWAEANGFSSFFKRIEEFSKQHYKEPTTEKKKRHGKKPTNTP